jgi:hypothetical protein
MRVPYAYLGASEERSGCAAARCALGRGEGAGGGVVVVVVVCVCVHVGSVPRYA